MFTFNASAVGFGGVVTTPRRKALSSVASAVLPPTGGQDSALEEDYRSDGVYFNRAYTSVYGTTSPDKRKFTTKTEISITGLRLFDVLEVDSMSASLTSVRTEIPAMDPDEEPFIDESFTVNASIEGVRVNGCEIPTPADCDFFADKQSYASFTDYVHHRDTQFEELRNRFAWDRVPRRDAEVVRCSFLRPATDIAPPDPSFGITRDANVIRVPGFGDIFLGEMLVKRGMRRLNLVRLELNKTPAARPAALAFNAEAVTSDDGGDSGSFASGSGEANGTPTYP
jgi:hypothetical protein